MKIHRLAVLLIMGGAVATAPAKNKKDAVSQSFCQAHAVYVQTANGDPQRPDAAPQDRAAANALIAQLQDWKRYTVVTDPQEADLIWVVRTGHDAMAGQGNSGGGLGSNGSAANQSPSGTTASPGSPSGSRGSGGASGSGGPGSASGPGGMSPGDSMGPNSNRGPADSNGEADDDVLAVYQRPQGGPLASPLWQKNQYNGLKSPKMQLFEKIRTAVDATCVAPAAPTQLTATPQ